ncbi:hypothetical protein BJX70DRAFT_95625 [Aspergillus crustosus]
MDPVLRICSHPDVGYAEWQCARDCPCEIPKRGWDCLYTYALSAYVCLNILYCCPELWDSRLRHPRRWDGFSGQEDDNDGPLGYRCTLMHQQMLKMCTEDRGNEVSCYPHRQFSGIPDKHFKSYTTITGAVPYPTILEAFHAATERRNMNVPSRALRRGPNSITLHNDKFPYGKLPFKLFLNNCATETPETIEPTSSYLPEESDIWQVSNVLYNLGLPAEIILQVLDLADYDTPKKNGRRVAHDPFHEKNQEQLGKYLTYCWKLLIRCNMFAQALGVEIDWKEEVQQTVEKLISRKNGEKQAAFHWY